MDILCLGQQNWDVCWTAKQQLLTRLAAAGHRVLYIDPQMAPFEEATELRQRCLPGMDGLRHVGPGELYVYTYIPRPALRWRINNALFQRVARKIVRRFGLADPVVLCMHPMQHRWLDAVLSAGLVYYAFDDYAAYGEMPEDERETVRAREEAILRRADIALGVSPMLGERFKGSNVHSHVLQNASDTEHYAPEKLQRIGLHPALRDIPRPVIGFIGQVDDRMDRELVSQIASRRPDWSFVFAGRVKGLSTAGLDRHPNVHFLGYQDYQALPSIAKGVDAWMVPYKLNPLTHACSPLKVYEYLATGKPVVTTQLKGLQACGDVVAQASGAEDFEGALQDALDTPHAGEQARLATAMANSWDARSQELLAFLNEARRHAWQHRSPTSRLVPARRLGKRVRQHPVANEHGQLMEGRALPGRRKAMALSAALARLRGRHRLPQPGQAKRILIARSGYLGDFFALRPALKHLRRIHPQAEITLGVQSDAGGQAVLAPLVDHVRKIDFLDTASSREKLRSWLDMIRQNYDLVLGGGEAAHLDEGLMAASAYVALHERDPRQEVAGWMLPRDDALHEADNMLALAEAATGIRASTSDRRIDAPEDNAAAPQMVAAIAEREGFDTAHGFIILHPGAKRATRRWPVERCAELISRLARDCPDHTFLLTGTAQETRLTQDLAGRVSEDARARLFDLAGRTNLSELLALLSQADLVICPDTGVMHLARASGRRLLALLGPENPVRWGPHWSGTARTVALRQAVPCAPCRRDNCPAQHCMRLLDIAQAHESALELLQSPESAAGEDAPVIMREARMGWREIEQHQHVIPRAFVEIEAREPAPEAVDHVITMLERQAYPSVTGLIRTQSWQDSRDASRRQARPLITLSDNETPEQVCRTLSGGRPHLLLQIGLQDNWDPMHIDRQIAAAMRSGTNPAFA